MTGMAWGKLLLNLNNAVNALSGLTLLEELQQRDYRRVVAASMVEALDVLKAAGIEPAQIGPIPPKLLRTPLPRPTGCSATCCCGSRRSTRPPVRPCTTTLKRGGRRRSII
jgi:hypothetical protein